MSKDDKWERGQKKDDFNEKSEGRNADGREGSEVTNGESQKDNEGREEPQPAPRPKGLGMDEGTALGMAGAPSEKNRNTPTHSEEEIKAWALDENTEMQTRYAEERLEMEGQHKRALDNQWDFLAEKQEKEREEVITGMQAEQEAELSAFDQDFNDSWEAQKERVNEAYEKGEIPEPKMGHGESQEKDPGGHEL